MHARIEHTLIVMPALNEEESVAAVVAEVFAHLPGVHCLVVDDGSTDGTAEQARAAGATVAQLAVNLGVGGAMRVGFRYALEHGFDYVVQVDSDGQHDPRSVIDLLNELDDADIALGARFAGEGDYVVKGPRRWAMVVLASMAKFMRDDVVDADGRSFHQLGVEVDATIPVRAPPTLGHA